MNLSFVAVRVKPDFIMFRWNASPLQTLKKIDSITTDLSLRLKIGSSNLVPRKSLCLFFRSFCLEYINAFLFLKLLCSCLQFKIMARYPLSNPNSGIHILHTVFFSFLLVLMRRICLTIRLELPKLVTISFIFMTLTFDSKEILYGEIRSRSFLRVKGLGLKAHASSLFFEKVLYKS